MHSCAQVDNDHPYLSDMGYFRAANLDKVFGRDATSHGAFNSPSVIYAMQQGKVG